MPPDGDADEIRLQVPAEAPMGGVVRVALRVLGGRAGLPEPEIDAVRRSVGDAFAAMVAQGDPGPVEVVVAVTPGHLQIELTGASSARTVNAPR